MLIKSEQIPDRLGHPRSHAVGVAVHLLVVEDDARLSRLLKRLLTQDRHVVETALTAEDGLEIATSTAELDTVILDVGLPDRSGFEVARVLRRKGSTVPILMLT